MAKLNSGTRVYGNTAIDTFLTVSGAVASTSNTTGTIIVTGGVGVSGNVYANGIYSNDKLGIGLTSAISPWTKLEIKGTAGSQDGANQQLSIQAPTTTAGQGVGIRLSAASGANEAVGIIGVVNNTSGTAGAMTFHVYNGGATVPEYMRLNNAGNLGVGVVAPSEKLAIDGNVIMTGNRVLILQNTGVAAGTISFRNSSGVQKSAIGSYYNIADEGDLEFINVGTTNMILRSTGLLGLGITAPTELLHISGTSAISGATHGPRINLQYTGTSGAAESRINFLDFRGTINASIGNYLSDDSVSTYAADLVFKTAVAGVFDERMRLSSGRLLIGATTSLNTADFQLSKGSGASSSPYAAIFNTATSPTSSASTRFDMGFLSGGSNYVATGTVLGNMYFMGQGNDAGYAGAFINATVISGGNVARASGHSIALTFGTKSSSAAGAVETMRLDSAANLLFNSGYGSVATAYGCRAWVNFNGTGTVAIRGSGNVSSITDNATADYTVNFTTAMPDANYAAVSINGSTAGGEAKMSVPGGAQTTAACRIVSYQYTAGQTDSSYFTVAIFR